MLNLTVRAAILFLALFVMTRFLGKRQIGQLQPYEFVLTLIVANLATVPTSDLSTPLVWGLLPILVLLVTCLFLSVLSMKSERARKVICGRPEVLIDRGAIRPDALSRVRYTLADLTEQLRTKDVFDLSTVRYAILETDGEMSVIPVAASRAVTPEDLHLSCREDELPLTVIADGKIKQENLTQLSEKHLTDLLKKHGIARVGDVFLMTYDGKHVFMQTTEGTVILCDYFSG